ncbi:MAG: 3-hydroxyacyl-CoA dehydrogenase NAD-binding domain-containing protein [Hyphomicrobiales bacterium]|nr:3-hydroxyacyl-CoA dehydrogenase NAD-binding domain-containing protein [Hyphomicrobiales bacterium]
MELANFTFAVDTDGVALVTWDMPGRSMNLIDLSVFDDLEKLVARLETDAGVKGAVITSAKESFSGGADLAMLNDLLSRFEKQHASAPEAAMQLLFDESRRLSQLLRRLETCGKPVAAALNGTALGGGFELALACHARFVADDAKLRLGLPEVRVGLFPGAGGTQRVARMLPAADALQMLLQGRQLRADQAKSMKLVDEVVPADRLVETARTWVRDGGRAKQPWDEDKFRIPGGPVYSKSGMMTFPVANAIYRRETYDVYPGGRAILQCVYEGLLVPMDTALTIESRHFARILRSPQARHMIRSLFVSLQALNKLARRPKDVAPSALNKVGILGAGFMGAGIAYVTASAGLDVVLVDRDMEAAEKGRAHAASLLTGDVSRKRISNDDKEAALARIKASADYGDLKGCDLIVEAVFEDRDVKKAVTQAAEAVVGPACVFGSNTSTLPITSLAKNSKRPESFIGIHFFSPVEKMMLIEIILGKRTGEKALAAALDYCRKIRKTPIVVNDSRGFYTSRVVATYIREGHLMLVEGIPAAMIENVARMAGMPVGPLALNDEVAVDLAWKIVQAAKQDLGDKAIDPRQERLLKEMVVRRGRLGRKNGKGFYDYPQGGKKHLWPGLAELAEKTVDPETVDIGEMKQRFLAIQALETARAFEEKVVTDVREADVGSILGFGFAPFSGGTLSYIDGMGVAAFVALCKRLAKKHGRRFKTNRLLLDMAAKGETFYGRFDPSGAAGRAA